MIKWITLEGLQRFYTEKVKKPLGDLTTLLTTNKDNIVNAINEIKEFTNNLVTKDTEQTITADKTFKKITIKDAIGDVLDIKLNPTVNEPALIAWKNKNDNSVLYKIGKWLNNKPEIFVFHNEYPNGKFQFNKDLSLEKGLYLSTNSNMEFGPSGNRNDSYLIRVNADPLNTAAQVIDIIRVHRAGPKGAISGKFSGGGFDRFQVTGKFHVARLHESVIETSIKFGYAGGNIKFVPVDNNIRIISFFDTAIGANCFARLDFGNKCKILNCPDPTEAGDVATKRYVDEKIQELRDLIASKHP